MNNLMILISVITLVVILQHDRVEGAAEAGDNTRYYCCSCCGYDLYCNRNNKGGISMEKSEKKAEPLSLAEYEKAGNGRHHAPGHSCCTCCGYTTSCNRMGNIFSLSQ